MKNIKMGLTALAVFAVVGGALAFKTKNSFGLSFCASTIQNSGCAVITKKVTAAGDSNFFYDQNWDGAPTHCSSIVCPTAVRLVTN